ncbi:hypothetical protein HIM_07323 [Hirsutella minnesotensis 3608]|uniref:Uncharacterized protein n=1 Tax=Hirsutella minnesotensis 3608 TaxID=1043627 RepID=A0A0F8A4C1_9HYPO|nr:hypothetical protein HIM_07323 [Hirsutella minnesotensis 3608]
MESCSRCTEFKDYEPDNLESFDAAEHGTWTRYVNNIGYQSVWDTDENETEQERYAAVTTQLEVAERAQASKEDMVVEKTEILKGKMSSHGMRDQLRKDFETVQSVAFAIEGKRQMEQYMARDLELRRIDWYNYLFPRSISKMKVRLCPWSEENYNEVEVTTTLKDPRYYLGHRGGDSIFRYKPDEDTSKPTAQEAAASIEDEWKTWKFRNWQSILDFDAEGLLQQIEYCGQVPRHMKEYTRRMQTIAPIVIKVVVSILAYHCPDGGPVGVFPNILRQFVRPDGNCARSDLARLYEIWQKTFEGSQTPFQGTRYRARRHPTIFEFALLLYKLHVSGSMDTGDGFAPLTAMLVSATGWSHADMIEVEDNRAAKRATHQLLHEKNTDHCFIFVDREVENIHEYYKDAVFQLDPAHPSNRFQSLEVGPALTTAQNLLETIQQHDASSSAEQELRNGLGLPNGRPPSNYQASDEEAEDSSDGQESDTEFPAEDEERLARIRLLRGLPVHPQGAKIGTQEPPRPASNRRPRTRASARARGNRAQSAPRTRGQTRRITRSRCSEVGTRSTRRRSQR